MKKVTWLVGGLVVAVGLFVTGLWLRDRDRIEGFHVYTAPPCLEWVSYEGYLISPAYPRGVFKHYSVKQLYLRNSRGQWGLRLGHPQATLNYPAAPPYPASVMAELLVDKLQELNRTLEAAEDDAVKANAALYRAAQKMTNVQQWTYSTGHVYAAVTVSESSMRPGWDYKAVVEHFGTNHGVIHYGDVAGDSLVCSGDLIMDEEMEELMWEGEETANERK